MESNALPLLPAEDLQNARNDLQTAHGAVVCLPEGLVKQRLQAALKEIDEEVQSNLWAHLRSTPQPRQQSQEARPRGNALSTSAVGQVLSKAIAAGVEPKSSLSAAALGIHSLLVSEGFICTGQDEKAAPLKGFAAPARDVPEDKLVPDQWDSDDHVVSFRYRRSDSAGKVFLFKAASTGGDSDRLAAFYFQEKGKELLSVDTNLSTLVQASNGSFLDRENEPVFEQIFSLFRREVLSHVLPKRESAETDKTAPQPGETSPTALGSGQRGTPNPPGPSQPLPVADDDPLREGPPRFPGPPGVGPTPFVPGTGGDFGGDIFPGGGGLGGPPGAGGQMGPGHSMFGGGDGAGYMEPRFDPYGPPMPDQPWGPGVPGGPGRGGGRGGPGRGGDGGRGPPGGPDNDHLRPPRGPDHMFF